MTEPVQYRAAATEFGHRLTYSQARWVVACWSAGIRCGSLADLDEALRVIYPDRRID